MRRVLAILPVLLLAGILMSCSGDRGLPSPVGEPGQQPPRQTATVDKSELGDECYSYQNCLFNLYHHISFDPFNPATPPWSAQACAWAYYEFDVDSETDVDNIGLTWVTAPASDSLIDVCVYNNSTSSWDWFTSGISSISVNNLEDYADAGGLIQIGVWVYGGDAAVMSQIDIDV